MKVTLSKHARRALAALPATHVAATQPAAPTDALTYVAKKQGESRKAQWQRRYRQTLAICGSAPMTHVGSTVIALALGYVLVVQPVRDERDQLRLAKVEAIAREQGKNQIRAEQDAELIKHHAGGGVKVTVFARNDDPKSLAAARAALIELGAK
jgi:hypothetical protein